MIDNEEDVFHQISDTLMSFFDSINVTDQKLRFYHSSYPVVSVVSTNNFIFEESLSLFETSCLSIEEFEFEIQSEKNMSEIKSIMSIIDDVMTQMGYIRVYCGLDKDDKDTQFKRLMQYKTAL